MPVDVASWAAALVLLGVAVAAVATAIALRLRLARERGAREISEAAAAAGERAVARALAAAQTDLVQAEKLASVGLVAAGVAHEVNNPAAYALANLALAEEALAQMATLRVSLAARVPSAHAELESMARADEGARQAIRDALEGLRRIRDIVADLRSLAQRGPTQRERIAIAKLVTTSVALAAPTVRDRAQLEVVVEDVPDVFGEANKLSQALINLLINAADATRAAAERRGHIALRVFSRGEEVVLEVRDDGEGIPPDRLANVFSPLESTRGPGTSLGLPICRRIAEEHGGRIEAESIVGEGSVFRLVLPAMEPEPERKRPSSIPPPTVAAADGEQPTVLVVDDERLFISVMKRYLGRRYRVVAVSSVDEAISLVRGGARPDVLLCDLLMPGKSGGDLYRALLADVPELAPRVTFMTGGTADDRLRGYVDETGRPCLAKPIEPDALLRHIEKELTRGRTSTPAPPLA